MNGIFDSSWGTYNILLCTILKKKIWCKKIKLCNIFNKKSIHVSAVKLIYGCM